MDNYRVRCAWDEEAKVWYVEDSNVPGLAAEASTFEGLVAVLEKRVPELLDENDVADGADIPLEIMSLSHRVVHRHAA
ncbi:DUF1902 domain-containing protein [Methyloversatilis sp. XJ19-13]|uniref:DUF1902 domain-containing protein n=1 Tax=Methyloversatilis sp. XJ19-13 TaxID=2963430 RepID=UPI00211CB08A|nr:DUF1902 domain-containing protein [Methyloversatilis sp. XJ19-13]MCQ9372849.1 DUF1902 domain-containing protein [Methyloversatilis sp. XJ19-13]